MLVRAWDGGLIPPLYRDGLFEGFAALRPTLLRSLSSPAIGRVRVGVIAGDGLDPLELPVNLSRLDVPGGLDACDPVESTELGSDSVEDPILGLVSDPSLSVSPPCGSIDAPSMSPFAEEECQPHSSRIGTTPLTPKTLFACRSLDIQFWLTTRRTSSSSENSRSSV
jgi:hypothetical protein